MASNNLKNSDSETIREEVLKLMQQKDKIEDEIKALTGILTQNGVGMNDPLVDEDGFPKNSIDIYQIRHARHKIICLQNDHKSIMKQIENGLQGYYATSLGKPLESTPMETDKVERIIHKTPFAKVTFVSPGSPAEYAGMFVNDELVEFGSVNAANFKNISDIATVVQHSEGVPVNLKVKRNERYLMFHLIPKKWSGRGLLGCNIVVL